MITISRMIVFLFCAAFVPVSMAQDGSPCKLVVPASVGPKADQPLQTTCPCRVSAFEAMVYDRWGVEVLKSATMEGFPQAILAVENLSDGTYLWKVKYTAISNSDAVELEQTGYITVLK